MLYLKIKNDECEASDLQEYFGEFVSTTPAYADDYCSWHYVYPKTEVYDLIAIMNNLDINNFEPKLVI